MQLACPISFDLYADAGLLLALFDARRSTRFFAVTEAIEERARSKHQSFA